MQLLKKILAALLILIVLFAVTGLLMLRFIKRGAVPDYDNDAVLSGLNEEVTIYRDAYGIPHIYAENEQDLYRSVGFVMAQDRLWQMDLLRRVTQGRLSEILGKDQAKTDLLMRALRIQEKSEMLLKTSSPEIRAALASFAEGFNAYLEQNSLPPEFRILGYKPEPWEPVHSINLIGYMSWDLSSGWGMELLLNQISKKVTDQQFAELIPDMDNHATAVFPEFEAADITGGETLLSASANLEELGAGIFSGSNNWAVSGEKSASGKPLLANDMHLGLFAPGIWYQMHQHVENKLNVTGLVLPGQPFVIAGHNDSIAWGMTNVMVDDIDFYAETLNEDSTKYMLDGNWEKLRIQNEKIKTREGEVMVKKLLFTHRGPIVNEFKSGHETALSIRWMGNERSNEIRSVYLLNRAGNWNDFREAVKTFRSVSQNIVFADVAGNIGLQTSAGIPVRPGNGIQVYPGHTRDADWTGSVPFEDLPYEYNPERGYVSSANNKTVNDSYPYYISHWFAMPNRINRIREMLEETDKFGIKDFEKIQADVHSQKAENLLPRFLDALKTEPNRGDTEKKAISLLSEWDHAFTRESPEATIFEALYLKTAENILKDDIPSELLIPLKGQRILMENLLYNILTGGKTSWLDDKSTPGKENLNDNILRSFKEVLSELTDRFGADPAQWKWGEAHTFTISHPLGAVKIMDKILHLNRGPYPVPGSYHTVCPYSYSFNNLYKVNHGASHRNIFDTSDWNSSRTVIPTGTSGIPASRHYLDQTDLYLNNEYHGDPFSKDEVIKNAKYRMTLALQ